MINKDGGGETILRFYGGDTAVMRGDIKLMGDPPVPPTRENPGIYHLNLFCHFSFKENHKIIRFYTVYDLHCILNLLRNSVIT